MENLKWGKTTGVHRLRTVHYVKGGYNVMVGGNDLDLYLFASRLLQQMQFCVSLSPSISHFLTLYTQDNNYFFKPYNVMVGDTESTKGQVEARATKKVQTPRQKEI